MFSCFAFPRKVWDFGFFGDCHDQLPPLLGVCVCVKHLNRFKTSPFFFSSFSPSNKGCQSQSRGHGSCFPSHANEAMAFNRKGMWTHIPVPAFIFVWRGAKPRTPKTENLVLHGCRNLRFSSASYSTLFALHFYSHGEGLSRKPYSDFFRILDII